jgi:hypothetical protein
MKKSDLKKLKQTTMFKRFIAERLMVRARAPYSVMFPAVGMGATTGAGPDCYPHTIIEVADDFSYIVIQSDEHHYVKETDSFTYSRRTDGSIEKFTLRKHGRYINENAPMKAYYCGVSVGIRRYYQDPSF